MPEAFSHGPHCVPQEDYARLMAQMNRALAANADLAAEITRLQEELRSVRATNESLKALLKEAISE